MNILLTCAGRRNYIIDYFKDALKEFGKVYAVNSTKESSALAVADQGFFVPPLSSPDYINAVITICREYDISVIISLFDLDLSVLAFAQKKFREYGINVIVSSPEVIKICNDKWKTCQFLLNIGLCTPKTFIDLNSAIQSLTKKEINYPLIIKPRWGTGSIGLMEADNQEELEVFYNKTQRIIKNSYISQMSESDESKHNVLIQEKLTGKEYGLDVINDLSGQYVTTFVKEKITMRSGETDSAVTVNFPQLIELGKHLSSNLQHIANLDVDVFVNGDNIYVLELNPRFGGGYPFSHLAGANIPAAVVAWLQNQTPESSWLEIEYGVVGVKGIIPIKI
jgi:carbamoyl-phosphate synthase large subunit